LKSRRKLSSLYIGQIPVEDMTIKKKMCIPILKKVNLNFDELAKLWFK